MLYAIVGMLVIILDQGVKYWVTNNIMLNTITEPLIPGILSLVRMHNDGAAFSFLSGGGARVYFVILTAVFTVAVIIALATNFINGKFGRWCLVLVTAGGLSNCLDRILYGFVVDMFKIDLFNFAVFNVADIFITVFSLLFIVYIIFGGEKTKNTDKDEFDEYDDEEADSRSLSGELRDTVDSVRERKTAKKPSYEDYAQERKQRKSGRRAAVEEDPEEQLHPMRKPKVIAPAEKRPVFDTDEDMSRRTRTDAEPARRARADAGTAAPARRARSAAESEFAVPSRGVKSAAGQEAAQPVRRSAYREEDPFAEWEKANAKAERSSAQTPAAKAMGMAPAKTAPVFDPAEVQPRKTERPAAPKAPAKTAPKAVKSDDEFSLDDILAEFK